MAAPTRPCTVQAESTKSSLKTSFDFDFDFDLKPFDADFDQAYGDASEVWAQVILGQSLDLPWEGCREHPQPHRLIRPSLDKSFRSKIVRDTQPSFIVSRPLPARGIPWLSMISRICGSKPLNTAVETRRWNQSGLWRYVTNRIPKVRTASRAWIGLQLCKKAYFDLILNFKRPMSNIRSASSRTKNFTCMCSGCQRNSLKLHVA